MSSKKYNGENLPDLDFNRKPSYTTNLSVVVRCRPLLERDMINNATECVQVKNNSTLVVTEPFDIEGHPGSEKARRLQFEFSDVFPKTSNNQEIYNNTAKPLLDGLFEGVNATIFTYGSAQSGKTYTLMGGNDEQGVVNYAINDLISMMDSPDRVGSIMKVSFVEIYNEVVRDLLVGDDKNLDIREDPIKGVTLNGVSEVPTSMKKDIMKMIKYIEYHIGLELEINQMIIEKMEVLVSLT